MKKYLILDIDETLVHATENSLGRNCDFETDLYMVYKRPYVDTFLEYCFENFNVAIWTSAGEEFAQSIVKALISNHGTPDFVWSHKRCTPRLNPNTFETIPVKNLDKVKKKGYHLDHTIMIDDTPEKLQNHYGNLIRVNPYLGQAEDRELEQLVQYLDDLKTVSNIRKIEKRGWQNRYVK